MKNNELRDLLKKCSPSQIIEALSPFILEPRKNRIESVIANRTDQISLAIENPADMHNALACVRSAEAFGLSEVHIIAPEHEACSIRAVTQGTFYWMQVTFHDSLPDFLMHIKKEKRLLAGAVLDAKQTVSTLPTKQPLCLVFGNEARGLSATARDACDCFFTIPMQGMAESLNLSVAAAVSIYDLRQRTQDYRVSEKKANALRAQYYLNSVNQRTILKLLT